MTPSHVLACLFITTALTALVSADSGVPYANSAVVNSPTVWESGQRDMEGAFSITSNLTVLDVEFSLTGLTEWSLSSDAVVTIINTTSMPDGSVDYQTWRLTSSDSAGTYTNVLTVQNSSLDVGGEERPETPIWTLHVSSILIENSVITYTPSLNPSPPATGGSYGDGLFDVALWMGAVGPADEDNVQLRDSIIHAKTGAVYDESSCRLYFMPETCSSVCEPVGELCSTEDDVLGLSAAMIVDGRRDVELERVGSTVDRGLRFYDVGRLSLGDVTAHDLWLTRVEDVTAESTVYVENDLYAAGYAEGEGNDATWSGNGGLVFGEARCVQATFLTPYSGAIAEISLPYSDSSIKGAEAVNVAVKDRPSVSETVFRDVAGLEGCEPGSTSFFQPWMLATIFGVLAVSMAIGGWLTYEARKEDPRRVIPPPKAERQAVKG